MILTITIILLINGIIGYILGRIFESKIKEAVLDHIELLKENETVESVVSKLRQLYLFFWIPLFFIDYHFIYKHKTKD
jgi:hypothetical protein